MMGSRAECSTFAVLLYKLKGFDETQSFVHRPTDGQVVNSYLTNYALHETKPKTIIC